MPDAATTIRAGKIPIGAMLAGPGPAAYALGTSGLNATKRLPASYSMGTTLTRRNKDRSPGPGKYNLKAGMLRSGSYTGSEYTMRIRPGAQKSLRTPGPNAYKMPPTTVSKESNAAAYTMRPQTIIKPKFNTPGPNVYKLQTYTGTKVSHSSPNKLKTAASWSMTGRSEVGSFTQQTNITPAPGRYRVEGSINTTKNKQPTYTMRPRCYAPGSNMNTPGPKYNTARSNKPKARGGTFGSKHSDYLYSPVF